MVDQERCALGHPSAHARRTEPAAPAREGHPQLVAAGAARCPHEALLKVTAAREPIELRLDELRQRVPGLFEAREQARQMPAHKHGRVAVVGLARDVDARARACGHDALRCIRPAARGRSPSRGVCCRTRAALGGALAHRPAGGPTGGRIRFVPAGPRQPENRPSARAARGRRARSAAEICRYLHGKVFEVGDALRRFDPLDRLDAPEDVKYAQPWVREATDAATGHRVLYVDRGPDRRGHALGLRRVRPRSARLARGRRGRPRSSRQFIARIDRVLPAARRGRSGLPRARGDRP